MKSQYYNSPKAMRRQQKYSPHPEPEGRQKQPSFEVVKELQIYSKQDIENRTPPGAKLDISLSMGIINSEIVDPISPPGFHGGQIDVQESITVGEERAGAQKGTGRLRGEEFMENSNQGSRTDIKNMQKQPGKHRTDAPQEEQREIQILLNKKQSNLMFMHAQTKQLIKLTSMSILIEDEKAIRARMSQTTRSIRKKKLSLGSHHAVSPYGRPPIQKNSRKHEKKRLLELEEGVKEKKALSAKLGIKLAILQNYLRASILKSPCKYEQTQNDSDGSLNALLLEQDLLNSNMITSRLVKGPSQQSNYQTLTSYEDMSQIANKEEYTSLLKQRLNNLVELNRQCLRNYEEKISLLVQDRAFLKREYDMINLNLKAVEKKGRLLWSTGQSIRKARSLNMIKYRRPTIESQNEGKVSQKKDRTNMKSPTRPHHYYKRQAGSCRGISLQTNAASAKRGDNSEGSDSSLQKTILKVEKRMKTIRNFKGQSQRVREEANQEYFDR